MDQIFQTIGDAIGSIFDNPVVQLGGKLFLIYWVILWIAAGQRDNAPDRFFVRLDLAGNLPAGAELQPKTTGPGPCA